MKIVITGATGFIGTHFTKQALAAGHSVLAIRRSPTSKPRITLEQQPEWLDRALDEVKAEDLKGCDVLVHLAAHTGNVPYDTLINCLRWNLMAVVALFEEARQAGIRRYVVAGSCFEYGHSGERYEAIPTSAPLEPTNSYSTSKAAASMALCQWAEEHGLSLDLLRVFHVFGEGEAESRLWPTLRRAALAGDNMPMTHAEQIRDFLAVEDVATTFLIRATRPSLDQAIVRLFNLSSGRSSSLREFANFWWKEWRAKGTILFGRLEYRPGEVMRYVPGDTLLMVGSNKDPQS
jgi:nucleoside-diphosphate-sugar epimerase